jgi:small-conductance mechanosensitive channel
VALSSAVVKLRDRRIFEVRARRGEASPEERAKKASKALEPLIEAKEDPEVRVVEDGDVAVVFAGQTPVIQLTPEDAKAAGDTSVKVHAAAVASRVKEGLGAERQRHHAAQGVFAVSLLVFSGLVAFLLIRKLDELTDRLRERLQGQRGEALRFRVGGIDVLPPGVLLGTLHVSLSAGRVLLRVALAYGWLAFGLSLFDATKGYTDRLTGALVAPLSELVKRLVSTAPLVVVLALVVFVLLVFVRFLRVLFQGYAEGTNQSQWIPADLAAPSGALAQVGVVLLALVAILPLVTGNDQGTAGRLGIVALIALGLGFTPLVASSTVGALQIFGRRLNLGDRIRQGKHEGKVVEINLLETRIERAPGEITRIPHLLGLVRATRIQRGDGLVEAWISAAPEADPAEARDALAEAASREGEARVVLEQIDRDGALFRVQVATDTLTRGELLLRLATALRARKIALGRLPSSGEAP